MGIFDGFLDKMKLSSEEDDYEDSYDDIDDEEDEEEVSEVRKSRSSRRSEDVFTERSDSEDTYSRTQPRQVKTRAPRQSAPSKPVSNSKVVSMRKNSSSNMEVCVFKPNNIEDGREISDTLLDGKAVVLNLEGIDVNLAQRIIDFTSGACYSIRGNLQKVSNYIFVVTPESVDISGDFQDLISSDFSLPSGRVF